MGDSDLNLTLKGGDEIGVKEIATMVGPMLGPYGMDHMVVDEGGEILLTKDGTTILQHLPLLHPYARLLLTLAKSQSQSVGDGSTSAVLLACSLLQSAQLLLRKGVHPTIIIEEYNNLLERSKEILQSIAIPFSNLSANNPLLMHVAKTSISPKLLGEYSDHFAQLALTTIESLKAPAYHKIQIRTQAGGMMKQSKLLPNTAVFSVRNHASALLPLLPPLQWPLGVDIFRQSRNHVLHGGKIFVSNTNLTGTLASSSVSSFIKASNYSHISDNAEAERSRTIEVCKQIASLSINVIVALYPVSPIAERYLIENGVLLVAVSTLTELEQIAVCASCSVDFSDILSSSIDKSKVGTFVGLDIVAANDSSPFDVLYISGNSGDICTVELNAPTDGMVEECRRSFTGALRVLLNALEEPTVIGGGGSAILELCTRFSQNFDAKTQSPYTEVCKQAFCDGLLVIPYTLAVNSGLEAVKVVEMAKQAHRSECAETGGDSHTWKSVNLDTGHVQDMVELGVVEPLSVFRQGLIAAISIVELILRTDKSIVMPPRLEVSPT